MAHFPSMDMMTRAFNMDWVTPASKPTGSTATQKPKTGTRSLALWLSAASQAPRALPLKRGNRAHVNLARSPAGIGSLGELSNEPPSCVLSSATGIVDNYIGELARAKCETFRYARTMGKYARTKATAPR
jgi:hypothetical protein